MLEFDDGVGSDMGDDAVPESSPLPIRGLGVVGVVVVAVLLLVLLRFEL